MYCSSFNRNDFLQENITRHFVRRPFYQTTYYVFVKFFSAQYGHMVKVLLFQIVIRDFNHGSILCA